MRAKLAKREHVIAERSEEAQSPPSRWTARQKEIILAEGQECKMDEWQSIGNHCVFIDEDILLIRFVGDISIDHTRALAILQEQIIARHGHLFAITDLRAAGTFSPEGRRFIGEWNKKFSVAGLAQYGGSLVARVTAMLMLGAIRALKGHVPDIKYVSDEAEGRAWISAQRHKLGLVVKR